VAAGKRVPQQRTLAPAQIILVFAEETMDGSPERREKAILYWRERELVSELKIDYQRSNQRTGESE
jgi:hypothetical protein